MPYAAEKKNIEAKNEHQNMRVARVIGNIVASAHHPAYDGHKLMLLCAESPDGAALGHTFIAVDHMQAGPGDRVLVLTEGTGVRQLLGAEAGPIRSVIVGIVDHIHTTDPT